MPLTYSTAEDMTGTEEKGWGNDMKQRVEPTAAAEDSHPQYVGRMLYQLSYVAFTALSEHKLFWIHFNGAMTLRQKTVRCLPRFERWKASHSCVFVQKNQNPGDKWQGNCDVVKRIMSDFARFMLKSCSSYCKVSCPSILELDFVKQSLLFVALPHRTKRLLHTAFFTCNQRCLINNRVLVQQTSPGYYIILYGSSLYSSN